jgi:ABC-type branched-subunit amino acid transport system substrate-binding protein
MQLRDMTWGGALLVWVWCASSACAQIVVGQTASFTGPVAAGVKETADGAKWYLEAVNARGGIRGQRIELVSMDDKYDPKLAAANARKLAQRSDVVALFLNRGTPQTEAILPVLEEFGLPLVAPSTGAGVLHAPLKKWVFNVRATYQREAEKAVVHLATTGLKRIAVVYADDSFGKDGLIGADKGFAKLDLKPLMVIKADRVKPDYAVFVPEIVKAQAQAVLWIGAGTAVADGVRFLRKAGSIAQVVTLSNNAFNGFIESMGEVATGVIVSQVFPSERSLTHPFVKEAAELARAHGQASLSPANLEGVAAAKVLVEGLRRAGPKASRASLTAALEGIQGLDLGGGLVVSYGPADHTGLDFADLSIIDAKGRFRR